MSAVELLARMAVEAACLNSKEQYSHLVALARQPFTPERARFALEAIRRRLACPETLLGLRELLENFASLAAHTVLLCYEASGWDVYAWDADRGGIVRAHSEIEFPADHPILSLPHSVVGLDRLNLRIKARMLLECKKAPAVVAWRENGKVYTQVVTELPRDNKSHGELVLSGEHERARDCLEAFGAQTKAPGRYVLVQMSLGGKPIAREVRATHIRRELDLVAPGRLAGVFDRSVKRLVIVHF